MRLAILDVDVLFRIERAFKLNCNGLVIDNIFAVNKMFVLLCIRIFMFFNLHTNYTFENLVTMSMKIKIQNQKILAHRFCDSVNVT